MRFSKRLGLGVAVPGAIVLALAGYLLSAGEQIPPRQPIDFSHRLHAEEKQIACVYCHQGATKSPVAGIPSVEKCMACHRTVAANAPEVRKIAAFWDKKEPIPWVRVVYLPDHVYFSHEPHISAGVECRTCHGPASAANGSFALLQPGMSYCLDCHRQKGASTDCATCHK